MSGVVDLNPLLRIRRQSSCAHSSIVIDETLADLECEACGKQLNPYIWIAQLCAEWDATATAIREYEERIGKEHAQRVEMMNHRVARLQAEIETLEAKKRQLMAEDVRGAPLGKQVKRWRRT